MRYRLLILILLVTLAGCATSKADQKLLTSTLESYAGAMRWGNFEDALAFVDPETLKAHPLTNLDMAALSPGASDGLHRTAADESWRTRGTPGG